MKQLIFSSIMFVYILLSASGSAYGAGAGIHGGPSATDLTCIPEGCVDNTDIAADSVTGAEILDKSLSAADIIDGPSSLLDADTLDGKDSSEFSSIAHSHTNTSGVAFQVYRNTGLYVPNNTMTNFSANVIAFDTGGFYDTTTFRYTPNTQ